MDRFAPIVSDSGFTTSILFDASVNAGVIQTEFTTPMDFDKLERKAKNIGNDAEKAVLVGLIPVLGLIFIWRLYQWYALRSEIESNMAVDRRIRSKFMDGKFRLWFAVLLWPVVAGSLWVYLKFFF